MSYPRVLNSLFRRMMVFKSDPAKHVKALEKGVLDNGENPGWTWTTFYTTSIELGFLTEEAARPMNLVVPQYADAFTATDITRSISALCIHVSGETNTSAEEMLRPYRTILSSSRLKDFHPLQLITIEKNLNTIRLTESRSLLELKNYIFMQLTSDLSKLEYQELSEVFLLMSKLGKSCSVLTDDMIEKIINHVNCDLAVQITGSICASLSRFYTAGIKLPNPPLDNYIERCFNAAMNVTCGSHHQITVLRSLIMLGPSYREKANQLLDKVKKDGLLNFEGSSLGMIFSIMAIRRDDDEEFINEVFSHVLPQLQHGAASTISSITKNCYHIGVNFPVRLAEVAVRRAAQLLPNETTDSAMSLLVSVSCVGSQSPKARAVLSRCIAEFVLQRVDNFIVNDYTRLTRALSLGFGRFRLRGLNEEQDSATIVHEIDPSIIDIILTRIAALRNIPVKTYLEIVKNLSDLGITADEMAVFLSRIYDKDLVDGINTNENISKLIRYLYVAECKDHMILREITGYVVRSGRGIASVHKEKLNKMRLAAGMVAAV